MPSFFLKNLGFKFAHKKTAFRLIVLRDVFVLDKLFHKISTFLLKRLKVSKVGGTPNGASPYFVIFYFYNLHLPFEKAPVVKHSKFGDSFWEYLSTAAPLIQSSFFLYIDQLFVKILIYLTQAIKKIQILVCSFSEHFLLWHSQILKVFCLKPTYPKNLISFAQVVKKFLILKGPLSKTHQVASPIS